MASQWLKEFARGAKATVHRYPAIKERTKDATNSDPWGPTDAQKRELATAAYDDENRALIYRALFKRLTETSDITHHVWKALDLLEFFLLMDVPNIMQELRTHGDLVFRLREYCYAKLPDAEKQAAANLRIRHKAQRLLDLMNEPELLEEEREKVFRIATRCEGGADANKTPTIGSRSHTPVPFGSVAAGAGAAGSSASSHHAQSPDTSPQQGQSRASPSPVATRFAAPAPAPAPQPQPQPQPPVSSVPSLLGDSVTSSRPPSSGWPFEQPAVAPQQQPVKPTPQAAVAPVGFDPFESLGAPSPQQQQQRQQASMDFFAAPAGAPGTRPNPAQPLWSQPPPASSFSTGNNSTATSGQSTPVTAKPTGAIDDRMLAQLDLYNKKAAKKPL